MNCAARPAFDPTRILERMANAISADLIGLVIIEPTRIWALA